MLTVRRFQWLSFKARVWRRIATVLELLWILPLAVLAAEKACDGFEVANAYGLQLQEQERVQLAAERARRDEAKLGLAEEKRRHAATLMRHAEVLIDHATLLENEVAELRELQRRVDDASA